jgi:hypothetical protein
MKLNANDKLWAPKDNPRYLLILRKEQPNPKTKAQFLEANVDLLERLQKEADPEEIDQANQILQNSLEWEVRQWLPPALFNSPKTPRLLLSLQLVEGSPLHEWKGGVEDALMAPAEDQETALEEVEQLDLETALLRMLED